MNARFQVPKPYNEPTLDYRPKSPETKKLKARIKALKAERPDIPLHIGGAEIRTGKLVDQRSPYDKKQLLGRYHEGTARHTAQAIDAALKARADWSRMAFSDRAAVFLKAADLLAADFRWTLNGVTMLCQSKSVYQAEIDAVCELVDFLRYNVFFAEQIYSGQPNNSRGMWNRLEYRPLEGFVFAVTPFNFTAIAGNLPASAALMGNTVVWKPAASTVYTAHYLMKLFQAAGLPDGVINMVTGAPAEVGKTALQSKDLAGVHFTGSTGVFQWMWSEVGANIKRYKGYPRLVGETGGKDFVLAHSSADVQALAVALVRGAFEFQGQKCSAASRAYVPKSLWPRVKAAMGEMIETIKTGSPEDFSNFFNAVIDKAAFDRIKGFIARAKKAPSCKILWGGGCDDSKGYFIEPTVIETTDPQYESMVTEIFGPVLSVFVYPDQDFAAVLALVDGSSPYALTGSIFAADRRVIASAQAALENSAGNFYINDKPTGAVVGQQPFGGARASGTNDKAGSALNLLRWVSPRTIKETFNPPHDYRYPFLGGAREDDEISDGPAKRR